MSGITEPRSAMKRPIKYTEVPTSDMLKPCTFWVSDRDIMLNTVLFGDLEVSKQAGAGSYIMSGTEGELYAMSHPKFQQQYDELFDTAGTRIAVPKREPRVVRQYIGKQACYIQPWKKYGDEQAMVVEPGDWMVGPNVESAYRVHREVFAKTYDFV